MRRTPIYSVTAETKSKEPSYSTSMEDIYARHINLLSMHISNSHCGNTSSTNLRVTNNFHQTLLWVKCVTDLLNDFLCYLIISIIV